MPNENSRSCLCLFFAMLSTAIVFLTIGMSAAVGQEIEVDKKAGTDGFVSITDVVQRNSENIASHEKRISALEKNAEKLSSPATAASSSMRLPELVSAEIVTVTTNRPAEYSGGWSSGNVSGGSTGNVTRWSTSTSTSNAGSTGNSYRISQPIVSSPIVSMPIVSSPPIVSSSIVTTPPTIFYETPTPPVRRPLQRLFSPPASSCRIVNGVRICN